MCVHFGHRTFYGTPHYYDVGTYYFIVTVFDPIGANVNGLVTIQALGEAVLSFPRSLPVRNVCLCACVCMCLCVRVCVCACVCLCVRVCVDRIRPNCTMFAYPLSPLSTMGPWRINVTFSEPIYSTSSILRGQPSIECMCV